MLLSFLVSSIYCKFNFFIDVNLASSYYVEIQYLRGSSFAIVH